MVQPPPVPLDPERMSPKGVRRFCAMAFLGGMMILIIACLLKPDPRGYGTHQQLGLPPCLTSVMLGVKKCPGCGLTTGFAHLVRGNVADAWQSNPMSLLFFSAMLICMGCALHGMLTGADRMFSLFVGCIIVCCIGTLIAWCVFFSRTPLSSYHPFHYIQ